METKKKFSNQDEEIGHVTLNYIILFEKLEKKGKLAFISQSINQPSSSIKISLMFTVEHCLTIDISSLIAIAVSSSV
jgi:hypothetical protein